MITLSIHVALALCTALCTVLVVLSTIRTGRVTRALVAELRTTNQEHERIQADLKLVKDRQRTLAARMWREIKRIADDGVDDEEPTGDKLGLRGRDPHTRDFVNGVPDSDIGDLIALQNAHQRAAEQRE